MTEQPKKKNSNAFAIRWLLRFSKASMIASIIFSVATPLLFATTYYYNPYIPLENNIANYAFILLLGGMVLMFMVTMSAVFYGMAHLLMSMEKVRNELEESYLHLQDISEFSNNPIHRLQDAESDDVEHELYS
jgi:ABC-type multidrug transport system fused ATPase/permease subunit